VETYIYFAAAATLSRLVPMSTGFARWGSIGAAGKLLVLFISVSFAGDAGMILLGRVLRVNNLWIQHVTILVQTPILLLAFAAWAESPSIHRLLRISAVAAVVAWFVVFLDFESLTRFARFTGTLEAALFCVGAVAVLIDRGLNAGDQVFRSDWFWVAIGVLLVHGLTAVHRPLLDLFTEHGMTAIPAWTVLKALVVLQVVGNLLFTRALLCARCESARPLPAPA